MSEREEALSQIRSNKGFPAPLCRNLEGCYDYVLNLMNNYHNCTYRDLESGTIVAQVVIADIYATMRVPTAIPKNNIREVHIGQFIGLIKNPADDQSDNFEELYGHMNGIVVIDGVLYCGEVDRGYIDLVRVVRTEHHDTLLEKFTRLISRVNAVSIPNWSHLIEGMAYE